MSFVVVNADSRIPEIFSQAQAQTFLEGSSEARAGLATDLVQAEAVCYRTYARGWL